MLTKEAVNELGALLYERYMSAIPPERVDPEQVLRDFQAGQRAQARRLAEYLTALRRQLQ